ncbi:MAG: SUMF1/EgtB/PvdO family nonheme iron enzyme [Candidatus Tectomicrobia bacterium]|nr:SUMF1/EgtB/PvdO family nonheme iron enzyme [Candidatus Tectomicrobia bacterium]
MGADGSTDPCFSKTEGAATEVSLSRFRDRAARPSKGNSEQYGKTSGADTGTNLPGKVAGGDKFGGTSPVGCDEGNAFGLQDVLGNVWGWVEDCRNESYSGLPSTGGAWQRGDCDQREVGGGGWNREPEEHQFTERYGVTAGRRNEICSFRVVRMLAR